MGVIQNNTSVKKAVLIELGGSHDINLYTQLLFLKHGGYHTTLIVDERVYKHVIEYDQVDELIECKMLVPFIERMKNLWAIRNYIVKNKVSVVVFNTVQGPLIRTLCLFPYPSSTRFTGTLHSLHKLKGSISQNILSFRVRKYFLLTYYLKTKAADYNRTDLSFEVFYPMFYMSYPEKIKVTKPENEFWIGIPGVLEYVRRDYKNLAIALSKIKEKLPLKFLLMGNGFHKSGDGEDFKKFIADLGVADYFMLWNDYLGNEEFHTYLKYCDAFMPLLHPVAGEKNVYTNFQISGTYNLAFAFKKPLIFIEDFQHLEDFKNDGIFYNLDSLPETLKKLPQLLTQEKAPLYNAQQWDFKYQAEKFLRFIEG